MPDRVTAEIVPFPGPARPPPQQRLVRALTGLEEALAAQRAAVTEWRASLARLQVATGRLGGSLTAFHAGLTRLDAQTARLNGEARHLQAWADRADGNS